MAIEKWDLVAEAERENRRSGVYFFVAAIFTLIVVELHFLVRLEPLVGGPYYNIRFYKELLPQAIAVFGSVYLVFDSYRRIFLLFRETRTGKVLTVFLEFLVLIVIYILAFARPNYWVFVIGFNLWMTFLKTLQLYLSLRGNLKRNKIEKKDSSRWLKAQLRRWMASTAIYGSIIILIGGFIYPPIIQAVTNYKREVHSITIGPEIVNWIALLVFLCLLGAIYYRGLNRNRGLFCGRRMQQLRQNLQKMYHNLEETGRQQPEGSKNNK